jgi:hypothetical protein
LVKARALAVVVSALLALLASGPADAARPLYGTVERGWVASGAHGQPLRVVPASAGTLVASFVWQRAPSPGQPLHIVWLGPNGFARAQWSSTTLAGDRPGTRLWASVPARLVRAAPGRWRVRLDVAGIPRATVSFAVAR